jgi:hypothetical protein
MTTRALPALLPLAWLAACGGTPASGPAAECAKAVQVYRSLPAPPSIVGPPRETSEGNVEIEYRGTDTDNLPVKGVASCTFAVGELGALTLIEAVVDGSPLDSQQIDSFRATSGERNAAKE